MSNDYTKNYYCIHSFSYCFANDELPENGITYDWIFENISDFVEQVQTLEDGGYCSPDKWDVIRQFAADEFYSHAIIDDTITDYDNGGDCTAIEFWMITENDDIFHPVLLSDLEQPDKWYPAGTYYGDK